MTGPEASLGCSVVRGDLVAWLDDELPAARATAIRAHLESCAGCQAERDALAGVWRDLDALPALEPRPGLFAEVEARVRAEAGAGAAPAGRVIRFPFAARAAGLAAALLLTLGGGFALTQVLFPAPQASGGGNLAVQPPPGQPQAPDPLRLPSPQRPADGGAPATPDGAEAPRPDGGPRVKLPSDGPRPGPGERTPGSSPDPTQGEGGAPREVQVAAAPPGWQELSADERAVVDNLDLLLSLEEVDDLEVIEALEVLDELSEEELGEG